jgi:hypothetical protein
MLSPTFSRPSTQSVRNIPDHSAPALLTRLKGAKAVCLGELTLKKGSILKLGKAYNVYFCAIKNTSVLPKTALTAKWLVNGCKAKLFPKLEREFLVIEGAMRTAPHVVIFRVKLIQEAGRNLLPA